MDHFSIALFGAVGTQATKASSDGENGARTNSTEMICAQGSKLFMGCSRSVMLCPKGPWASRGSM